MKNILDDLSWRYATKKFDPNKKLEKERLDDLAEVFRLTATSYGLQPCRMVIVGDQDLKDKMVPLCYGQEQVKDASEVLVLCVESQVDSAYIEKYFELVKKVRETPDDILKPFKDQLKSAFTEKERREVKEWATRQAYIILGSLMMACANDRIDACPMEGFVPEKIDKLLELDTVGLNAVLLLPVGYRAEDDFFSELKKVRRTTEEIIRYV